MSTNNLGSVTRIVANLALRTKQAIVESAHRVVVAPTFHRETKLVETSSASVKSDTSKSEKTDVSASEVVRAPAATEVLTPSAPSNQDGEGYLRKIASSLFNLRDGDKSATPTPPQGNIVVLVKVTTLWKTLKVFQSVGLLRVDGFLVYRYIMTAA